MRTIIISILFFSITAVSAQKRVVIIGLDGFGEEGFRNIKHPNIDEMLSSGLYSLTTRPVMPSVTLPNWTSHLSGAGPEEHGVTGNDWTIAKHSLEPLEKDNEGYFPNIFKVLKEQTKDVKIGYYYNWKELINSMNPKYFDEASFEAGNKSDENYQKAFDFVLKNQNNPTLVFLYAGQIDNAGHTFGWRSDEYRRAVEEADVAIGELMGKLKSENLYKDTHFILISDHGGIGKSHGGVSMLEMQVPWGVSGPKIKAKGEMEFFNSNKNTALVIAKIFGIKSKNLPKSWIGVLPEGIFK